MKLILTFVFFFSFALVTPVLAQTNELQVEAPAALSAEAGLNENNIEEALKAREIGATQNAPSVKAATAQKESEIPVLLESKKGEAAANNPFAKMLMGVFLIAGLSAAGWLLVRKYRFGNKGQNPATQMKILTQHHLGPKKSLAIVRVAGESMLIGITDHHISLIKSLSLLDEDIPEEVAAQSFGKVLGKKTRTAAAETDATELDGREDDFSITGIKDVVSSRLKSMRSFE